MRTYRARGKTLDGKPAEVTIEAADYDDAKDRMRLGFYDTAPGQPGIVKIDFRTIRRCEGEHPEEMPSE